MHSAGFGSSVSVRRHLQASLYYARKRRRAMVIVPAGKPAPLIQWQPFNLQAEQMSTSVGYSSGLSWVDTGGHISREANPNSQLLVFASFNPGLIMIRFAGNVAAEVATLSFYVNGTPLTIDQGPSYVALGGYTEAVLAGFDLSNGSVYYVAFTSSGYTPEPDPELDVDMMAFLKTGAPMPQSNE